VLDSATGEIKVYYGAADTRIALATANLGELLGYLRACSAPIDGRG
jgi:predicted GH43/DUF377 family glycosyl hydrolase